MCELNLDLVDIFDIIEYIDLHIILLSDKEFENTINILDADSNKIKDVAKYIYDIQQDKDKF